MKLKLKLNVDGAKRVLIQHGEKAAFGLAAFLLLLFFWKTLRMEVLGADKQPEMLSKLADQTRAHVLASVWPKTNIEIVDYPARAEHVALVDDDYRLKVFFDKPLWEQHDKRPTPKLWPVEELTAASAQGIFAIKTEGEEDDAANAKADTRPVGASVVARGAKLSGGAAPKGYFYIAVTGLVPLRKQTAEYDDAFRSAQKYDKVRDVPVYEREDMKIERADVTGGNPKLAWQEIDLAAVGTFVDKWAPDPIADVVDSQYIDDACTMPLGPLLGEDWDPRVAGHPKIPPAERFDQTKKTEKKETPAPATGRRGWGGKDKPGAKSGDPEAKPSAPAEVAKGGAASSKPDQKLFRFVDYTVEPGKQYRYRVKLALQNPNRRLPDQYLKEPALARTPTLETPWSEPTPAVTVPRGFRVLAGPMIKLSPSAASPDPAADVCVVSFDPERGGEPAAKTPVQRGTVLNFLTKDDLWVLLADHSALSNWGKVAIRSNALVVDVQGGRKFGQGKKALIEPVELFILDAEGRAVVHDELDDADEFHSRIDPVKDKDKEKKKAEPVDDKSNPYDEMRKPRGGGGKAKVPKTPASKATRATTGN